jgi:hypothetical protein
VGKILEEGQLLLNYIKVIINNIKVILIYLKERGPEIPGSGPLFLDPSAWT